MLSSMTLLPAVGLRRKGRGPTCWTLHVPEGRVAKEAELGRKKTGLWEEVEYPRWVCCGNGLSKAVSVLEKEI